MTLAIWFWLVMALWVLLGLGTAKLEGDNKTYANYGFSLFGLIEVILLGIQVFGNPFKS